MTLQEIAVDYVNRFRSVKDEFSILEEIAADIVGSWTMTEAQRLQLLELIRAEFHRRGGEPCIVRDGSNAGTLSLVAMLSAKIKARVGK